MSRLLLVDGANYYFRAFHAIRAPMSAPDGTPTNAVFGFARMLLQMLQKHQPTHIAYVFDPPGGSFRQREFPQYKAHRSPMPDELRVQLPFMKELLDTLGIPQIMVTDYEADDVIGTLVQHLDEQYSEVWIVSGDKDLMQFVGGNTFQYEGMKGTLYDREKVHEKWGVWPEQIVDMLALMGDSSDNIPGVPGIGQKGAASLLNEYQNLENILNSIEDFKGKRKENLETYAQQGRDSKYLATIVTEVPLDQPAELVLPTRFDPEAWDELSQRLGFGRIRYEMPEAIAKWRGEDMPIASSKSNLKNAPSEDTIGADDGSGLAREETSGVQLQWETELLADDTVMQFLEGHALVSFDIETTGLNPRKDEILGLAFGIEKNKGGYLPLQNGVVPQSIRDWLRDEKLAKVGHNLKFDIEFLMQQGIEVRGVVGDSYIAHALSKPLSNSRKLDSVVDQYLGHTMISFDEVTHGTMDFRMTSIEAAANYAVEDTIVVLHILPMLEAELRAAGSFDLYKDVEIPLISVLAQMELRGIRLDAERLRALGSTIDGQLMRLTETIANLAGKSFNLNSTQQLSQILFEDLGLPTKGVPKNKSGLYSTKAEVLEDLVGEHEIIEHMLLYRKLEKLRNTYVEPLPQMIDAQSGRIHTSYQQNGAATGRMSSTDPNLQNIPVKDDWGREIRFAFVPDAGNKIISADYSQIELRVFAHYTNDRGLVSAFMDDADIHARTAAQMFDVPESEVTSDLRRRAKAINFGLLYGMGARRLGKSIGVSQSEAKALIEKYFERFPDVKAGMEKLQSLASETEVCKTLFGRVRPVPEINSPNGRLSSGAQRIAVNTPIQGTAADIIKKAMLAVESRLQHDYPEALLLLQVHDELIVEAPAGLAKEVAEVMRDEMQRAADLCVPLKVDFGIANNWGEAH